MPKKFPPRGKQKVGRRAEKRGKKKTKARKVFTPGQFPTPEKFNKITKFDEEREVYPSEDSSSTGRMETSDAGSDSTDSELERAAQESRVVAEVSRYKRAREARHAEVGEERNVTTSKGSPPRETVPKPVPRRSANPETAAALKSLAERRLIEDREVCLSLLPSKLIISMS